MSTHIQWPSALIEGFEGPQARHWVQTVTFNSVTKPGPFLESLVVAVQLSNSS
jgi:hypothetical protein